MLGIFFAVLGVAMLIYGLLTILGVVKSNAQNDSEIDKKLFSERNRYFIGRYWAGFQGVAAGVGLIVLGLALFLAR